MNKPIDFVVTWVDGNDSEWLAEKNKYSTAKKNNGSSKNRYRDWGWMRYWFRGVEKFAPWVHHVYFVTCGHYPPWLNFQHPKLRLVCHKDYIPEECLPTYNSNVIELYINRIKGLEEQFVLFNDDMFLTAPVTPEDFFRKGLPCESALLDAVVLTETQDIFPHTILNNFGIINQNFDKQEVLRRNAYKFFSPRYGKDLVRNVMLCSLKYFSVFRDLHLPTSYQKKVFDEVWKKEGDLLQECGLHRFRCSEDYTHWLMKCWQICEGNFYPRSSNWGKVYHLGKDQHIRNAIIKQKYKTICLNDCVESEELFVNLQKEIERSFQILFPEESSYEK